MSELRLPVPDPIAEDTDRAGDSGSQFESADSVAPAVVARLSVDDERVERRECRTGCGWAIDIYRGPGPVDQRAGIDRMQRTIGYRRNAGLRRAGSANCQFSTQGSIRGRVGLRAARQRWRQQQECRPDRPTMAYPKFFSCRQLTRSSGCQAGSLLRSASPRQQHRPAASDNRPPLCANCCSRPRKSRAGADRQ